MIEILFTRSEKRERLFFNENIEAQKKEASVQWISKKKEADNVKITNLICICSDNSVMVYNPTKIMLAEVAFKTYDYEVPSYVDGEKVEEGDYITVETSDGLKELKILRLHGIEDKVDGITYKKAKKVTHK